MRIKIAKRLNRLPPYLFIEIDRAKRKALRAGRDLIDLGIGDPDLPTPRHIIESLYQAAKDPANHRYALDSGMLRLRLEIARWFKKRFKVNLDPEREILPLIGSKEGLAHIPFAFLNNNDISLVPDPCYPPYRNATILAGGRPYLLPLLANNDFLPDFKKIPRSILNKTKIMFLNYPNNPTSAVAPLSFFKEVVRFAQKYNIIICSDLAYSEMCYDGYHAPSIFQISGAREVAVEFHSFSKTYNMTGWRIGWVCGNTQVVSALGKIKSNIDSGIFQAVQIAGIAALKTKDVFLKKMCGVYEQRRDVFVNGLKKFGWQVNKPKATFYIWSKVPRGKSSIVFCDLTLKKTDIVATPGIGFGKYGEGYVRFALTQDKLRLKEAIQRLSSL